MQSTKIFASTTAPFWEERDPVDGKRKMSVTLSDRLTGAPLVDYGPSRAYRGSGCFFIRGMTTLKFQGYLPASLHQPAGIHLSEGRHQRLLYRLGHLRENELGK